MSARLVRLAAGLVLIALASPIWASIDGEIRNGAERHEELRESMRFYTDPVLSDYVSEVGNKLAANSSLPDIPWHFTVIDDEAINAFATQGGYVYVHRGLMTFLTSEAQLAAVLAHEIAHVTERHLARQRSASTLGKVLSTAASLAVWNSNVGEAIDIWNAARISGYGRDMELEADQVGAHILYKSGYEPQALIEVLSLLKDHETFMSKQAGGRNSSYHGVFATHPRSDQRLQEVVGQAGQLPPGEAFRGRDEYRRALDGQIFGANDTANAPPGFKRFANRGLGITLLYPDVWSLEINGAQVTFSGEDIASELVLEVDRMEDPAAEPEDLLKSRYQSADLRQVKNVYEDENQRDDGRLALIETESGERRVAVIKVGGNAFYFASSEPALEETVDEQFVRLISSFRRAGPDDYGPDQIKYIYYQRLKPGETFVDLARESRVMGQSAEDMLRLLNGYYPSGQPQPGTWMKLVRVEQP